MISKVCMEWSYPFDIKKAEEIWSKWEHSPFYWFCQKLCMWDKLSALQHQWHPGLSSWNWWWQFERFIKVNIWQWQKIRVNDDNKQLWRKNWWWQRMLKEEDEDLLTWGDSVSKFGPDVCVFCFLFSVFCLKEEDEDWGSHHLGQFCVKVGAWWPKTKAWSPLLFL